MKPEDFKDLQKCANWLNETTIELISTIIDKHTRNILEEMQVLVEDRKALKARIAELERKLSDIGESMIAVKRTSGRQR